MRSAEFVKIAAAKLKEKENDQKVYSSSSGVHAKDELRILFASKRVQQQQPLETVKQQQQLQQQQPLNKKLPLNKEDEETEIIPDYKRISINTTSELESRNEDIALNNTDTTTTEHAKKGNNKMTQEIQHPEIHINNEESCEFNDGDKELISDKGDNMNSEKSLLVALSFSLESDLPAEFYERLFRESQIQRLINNSDSFRSGVEILCKMHNIN